MVLVRKNRIRNRDERAPAERTSRKGETSERGVVLRAQSKYREKRGTLGKVGAFKLSKPTHGDVILQQVHI